MTVPAWDIALARIRPQELLSSQRDSLDFSTLKDIIAEYYILENLVQRVSGMQIPVGIWGSIMQNERRLR